jgi:hypothetical protein
MQAQTSKRIGRWAKLGRAVVRVGSLMLVGESWLLIARAGEFWRGSGAATLGWLAALGALVQKALSVLVWSDGLLLAAMGKVLVLCCPLVILFAGFVMMKNVTHTNEAASVQGQSTSAEGDDR